MQVPSLDVTVLLVVGSDVVTGPPGYVLNSTVHSFFCTVQYTARRLRRAFMPSKVQPEQEQYLVEGRSAQKRRAILDAAREVFLKNGYPGASMDEVAALADVSKVTVYKHFSDKHSLFIAVFTGAIEEAEESSRSLVDHLAESVDVETDLRK